MIRSEIRRLNLHIGINKQGYLNRLVDLIMLFACLLLSSAIHAKTLTVLNNGDAGAGSLRNIISNANANPGHDQIIFDRSVRGTINISSGELVVTSPITITGNDRALLTINAHNTSRVFKNLSTLEILGITIQGGSAQNGGGILNEGKLTLINSTMNDNLASLTGGAIYNVSSNGVAMTTIQNSTISSNMASSGGAIGNSSHADEARITIINSTIYANSATNGNSLFNQKQSIGSAKIIVTNSILSSDTGGNVCSGNQAIQSLGFNLGSDYSCSLTDNTDKPGVSQPLPQLFDNSGPSFTHALREGHPAIDAIPFGMNNCDGSIADDQRGMPRPLPAESGLNACDIGAYERSGGRMGDLVWEDTNSDGYQDTNEPGISGITVKLRVDCETATVLTTTTDEAGRFWFTDLTDRYYQLEFTKPPGYSFSEPLHVMDFTLDSNADTVTGLDQCRLMAVDHPRRHLDAGLIPDNPGTSDALEIIRAIYYPNDQKIWIKASSDAIPAGSSNIAATVVINGVKTLLGQVGWKSNKNAYQQVFKNISGIPESVILNSNLGGSITGAIDGGNSGGGTGTSVDTLTIKKALYYPADNRLWIKATSDTVPAGSSTITASAVSNGVKTELGQIGWKPNKNTYQQVFKNITSAPDSIILNSNLGGFATRQITIR